MDCNYYDRLEAWATTQAECAITIYGPEDTPMTVTARIKDVYARSGEEFLELDNGTVFRLDRLIAINGIPVPGNC
ncbi:hypothetical protein CK934_18410 [Chitinophaga sp. MD30]|nr:hypothetical protein CK934_18410 [Chitinophaga sp. MD30]